MKTKIFTLGLFAMILSIALVSAASLSISNTNVPSSVNHDASSFAVTFDLTNAGQSSGIDWSGSSVSQSGSVSFDLSNIADGSTTPVTESVTATVSFPDHKSGSITGTIVADPTGTGNPVSFSFSVPINDETSYSLSTTPSDGKLMIDETGTLVVENTGNTPVTVDLIVTSDFAVTLSEDQVTVSAGNSESVIVTPSVTHSELDFGSNAITITADGSNNVQSTASFSIQKTFCSSGTIGGNLEIKDFKVNNEGDGKDDEWKLLDRITVEVEIENTGLDNIDVDDIFVEIALFDNSGKDVTGDLDFQNTDEEEIDFGNLDEDDEDTVEFEFLVTSDMDSGSHKLVVKAYSDDLNEDVECVDQGSDLSDTTFEAIKIEKEKDEEDFLKLDDVRINPSQVTCGETVDVSFDIVNVGDENLEDRFRVNLFSNEFNLDLEQDIRKDLDEGDTEKASFTFVVPEGLADGPHTLRVTTEHDYNSRTDTFKHESADETPITLTVIGCSGVPSQQDGIAAITASLASDAKPGQQLIIRSTVTNLEDSSMDFVIGATGYESWASLDSVSDRLVTLGSGESRDITLTFTVDADVSGSQSFVIEAKSGSRAQTREVQVNIAGAAGLDLGGNSLIWVIGIINVILIILIIIVAVRLSSR